MLKKVVDFFKAPIFPEDEEKTRRAHALNALQLNMGSAVLVLGTMGVLFIFAEKLVTSTILVVGFLITLIGIFMNRRGQVQASGIFMLGFLWVMTVVMATISGGIRSLDIIFFVSGTAIAGIVLGARGALFYAGWSLLTGLGFIMVGNAGFEFPQLFTFPPISAWIILFINLVFTVIPLQVTLQSLADSISRARASEERYRLIAAVMSDYAFSAEYGAHGELTDQWLGGAFEAITGYTSDEHFARGGWTKVIHPDDKEQDERDMAQLCANQKVISEIRIIRKDGDVRWVRSYAHPKWDEKNDRLAGIYGAVQDITERKQVETDLYHREAILDAVAVSAELLFRATDWKSKIEDLLERLGKSINASHAYFFENRHETDGRILTSMLYEWTAPGFSSDLNDPYYMDVYLDEVTLATWHQNMSHGSPYIGDEKHLDSQDYNYLIARDIKALLEVPIHIDGHWWGSIGFDDMVSAREWTNAEVDALRVAANVLAAVIKRGQIDLILQDELAQRQTLIKELELRNAESETLRESAAIVAATLERSEAVERILEQLEKVIHYNSASVQLLNGDMLEIVSSRRLDFNRNDIGIQFPLNENEPAYPVIQGRAPYILYDDVQVSLPSFNDIPHNNIHAWMAIPLKVKGQIIGIIALDGEQIGQFSERDAKLAVTYANQVAVALENARLFSELQEKFAERQKLIEELEQRAMERQRLLDFSRELLATVDISESLKIIKRTANDLIPHDVFSPYWVDETAQVLRPIEIHEDGWLSSPMFKTWTIPFGQGIIGDAAQKQQALCVNNSHLDPRSVYPPGFREKIAQEHSIFAPLHSGKKFIGMLVLLRRTDPPFTQAEFEVTQFMVSLAGLALSTAQMFAELESKNAELERFTYTVSHDLRSPLVTIKGFLGYLEKDASAGNMENFRKDMARISNATDRMDTLLKDVLELSRIGRLVNKPKEVSFGELVQEAVEIVHGRLEARDITLQTQPNLPLVNVDKPRLIEVLQNLIDNAAKYMGDQQTNPMIEIGTMDTDALGHQTFFVRDNGMGIAPEYHERIFGLFDKLDAASEGTGIGLALVKRIIEFHGGTIWVESQIGQGSTFYFTLPRVDA